MTTRSCEGYINVYFVTFQKLGMVKQTYNSGSLNLFSLPWSNLYSLPLVKFVLSPHWSNLYSLPIGQICTLSPLVKFVHLGLDVTLLARREVYKIVDHSPTKVKLWLDEECCTRCTDK